MRRSSLIVMLFFFASFGTEARGQQVTHLWGEDEAGACQPGPLDGLLWYLRAGKKLLSLVLLGVETRKPQILILSGEDGAGAYQAGILDGLSRLIRAKKLDIDGVAATSMSAVNSVLFGLALDPRARSTANGPASIELDPEEVLWPFWRDAQFELLFPGDATCAEYAALTKSPSDCIDDRPYADRDELGTQVALAPVAEMLDRVQTGRWHPIPSEKHCEPAQEPLNLSIQLTASQPQAVTIVEGIDARMRLRIAKSQLAWRPDGPRFEASRNAEEKQDEAKEDKEDEELTNMWLPTTVGDGLSSTVLMQVLSASAAFPMFSAPRTVLFCGKQCRPADDTRQGGLSCPAKLHLCEASFTDGLSYGRIPLTAAVDLADRLAHSESAERPDIGFILAGSRANARKTSRTPLKVPPSGDLKRGAAYYLDYVKEVVATGADIEASSVWRHRFTDAVPIPANCFAEQGVRRIERKPITADYPLLGLPAGLPFMRGATPFLDPVFRRFDYLMGRIDALNWWYEQLRTSQKNVSKAQARDAFGYPADAGFELLLQLQTWHAGKSDAAAAYQKAMGSITLDPDAHALYLVWSAVVSHGDPDLEKELLARENSVKGDLEDLKDCVESLPEPVDIHLGKADGVGGFLCRLKAAERASPADWCEIKEDWNSGSLEEARFRQACFAHRPWHTLSSRQPDSDRIEGDFLTWRHRTQMGLLSRGEAVEDRSGGAGRIPLVLVQAALEHDALWRRSDWGWHHSSVPYRVQQSEFWGAATRLVLPSGIGGRLAISATDRESQKFEGDDNPTFMHDDLALHLDWSLIHGRWNSSGEGIGLWLAGGVRYQPGVDEWALGPRLDLAFSWSRAHLVTDFGARALGMRESAQKPRWRLVPQLFVRSFAGHLELAYEQFSLGGQPNTPNWQFILSVTDLGGLGYWLGRLAGFDLAGPELLKKTGASPL